MAFGIAHKLLDKVNEVNPAVEEVRLGRDLKYGIEHLEATMLQKESLT